MAFQSLVAPTLLLDVRFRGNEVVFIALFQPFVTLAYTVETSLHHYQFWTILLNLDDSLHRLKYFREIWDLPL